MMIILAQQATEAVTQAVHTSYRLSWLPIVLLVLCVLFAIRNHDRLLAVLLGAGAVLFLLSVVLWLSYARLSSQEELTRQAIGNAEETETAALVKANNDLWEKLNRPRIPLGNEAQKEKPELDSVEVSSEAQETAKDVEKLVPEERPDWVRIRPKRVGNVYREVVVSGPHVRVADCHQELGGLLLAATKRRAKHLLGTQSHYPGLEAIGVSLDYVWREICHEEWVEAVDSSVGEMKRVHVLMEFDAAADKRLQQSYRDYFRSYRIEMVVTNIVLALSVLIGIYAVLKIDTWTRGYYTKRLFFGVPAVIIMLLIFANS